MARFCTVWQTWIFIIKIKKDNHNWWLNINHIMGNKEGLCWFGICNFHCNYLIFDFQYFILQSGFHMGHKIYTYIYIKMFIYRIYKSSFTYIFESVIVIVFKREKSSMV